MCPWFDTLPLPNTSLWIMHVYHAHGIYSCWIRRLGMLVISAKRRSLVNIGENWPWCSLWFPGLATDYLSCLLQKENLSRTTYRRGASLPYIFIHHYYTLPIPYLGRYACRLRVRMCRLLKQRPLPHIGETCWSKLTHRQHNQQRLSIRSFVQLGQSQPQVPPLLSPILSFYLVVYRTLPNIYCPTFYLPSPLSYHLLM